MQIATLVKCVETLDHKLTQRPLDEDSLHEVLEVFLDSKDSLRQSDLYARLFVNCDGTHRPLQFSVVAFFWAFFSPGCAVALERQYWERYSSLFEVQGTSNQLELFASPRL